MSGFNKVILLGNLTKDPEIRYTPNGTPVANFALAVNRRFKQGGDIEDEVCYVDIVVFEKQSDSCSQYINKGDSVLIDGRLQQKGGETEDGQKRSRMEVVAQSVQFMPKRQGTVPSDFVPDEGGGPGSGGAFNDVSDDETPF